MLDRVDHFDRFRSDSKQIEPSALSRPRWRDIRPRYAPSDSRNRSDPAPLDIPTFRRFQSGLAPGLAWVVHSFGSEYPKCWLGRPFSLGARCFAWALSVSAWAPVSSAWALSVSPRISVSAWALVTWLGRPLPWRSLSRLERRSSRLIAIHSAIKPISCEFCPTSSMGFITGDIVVRLATWECVARLRFC